MYLIGVFFPFIFEFIQYQGYFYVLNEILCIDLAFKQEKQTPTVNNVI